MSRHTLATRPKTSTPAAPHAAPSGGSPLDRQTRTHMEARFGHDFSSVRIHTDSRAEESAGALGANAYALGSDIVFGAGQYAPGSRDTERLMAHELTHVVQQERFGPGDPSRVSDRADASEREAHTAADRVMSGETVTVHSAPQAGIARDDAPAENHNTRDYAINMLATAGGFLPGPLGLAATALGGEESIRTLPDANDPMRGMKTAEGAAGYANSALGLAAGMADFDAVAALGGSASTVAGGAGLEGAAALGPAGLVAGAGLAGMATGHYLAENTEVGDNTVGALGGIDHLLGGTEGHSSVVALDDYRQQQWDRGGVGGVAKSVAAGVGEGALGLAGAVGGLAEGAWHGLGWLGRHAQSDNID